jgi:hypothetical protein
MEQFGMGQKSIQELRDMVVALQERVTKLEKRCGESEPLNVDDDPTHELPSLEQALPRTMPAKR